MATCSGAVKACVLSRYGGPSGLSVTELSRPTLSARDLLIKVVAAGVNQLDWKIRDGKVKAILPLALPAVLGSEASGVVEEVGSDVRGFVPGDEVFVRLDKLRMGAFAQYVATDASLVARKPERLSHEQAAGLPLAGLTAWQALHDLGGLEPGHRVLVHAGAGGVGSLAVQIAAAGGAHVTATASQHNHAKVKELGADRVIDYRHERFEAGDARYDIILDTVGGETLRRSFAVLAEAGMLVSIAAAIPDALTFRALGHPGLALVGGLLNVGHSARARRRGGRYRYLFMRPDGQQLAQLGKLVEAGQLEPLVDRVFSLENVADAFAHSESRRARGKIIIQVQGGQESSAR